MNKELLNVLPFNELFYKTCYYNPLFTVIRYFNGNINLILSNDILFYNLDKNNQGLSLSLVWESIIPENKILEEMNINRRYVEMSDPECAINYIKNSILHNRLIIIPVDCYYHIHPFGTNIFYKKQHHNHYFLVYGFNDSMNTFKIIDVDSTEWRKSNCCYSIDISYQNMQECYDGYIKYFNEDKLTSVLQEFSQIEGSNRYNSMDSLNQAKNVFEKNTILRNKEIENGIEKLIILIDNIHLFNISEPTSWFNMVSTLSNKYRISKFYSNEGRHIDLIEMISNKWDMIRLKIIKSQISNQIEYESYREILLEIYDLEKEFNDILLNCLIKS